MKIIIESHKVITKTFHKLHKNGDKKFSMYWYNPKFLKHKFTSLCFKNVWQNNAKTIIATSNSTLMSV